MEDLIEFLKARTGERLQVARANVIVGLWNDEDPQPSEWLATLEAHSRIFEEFSWEGGETRAVMYLAQPYASHPDFREEWRL